MDGGGGGGGSFCQVRIFFQRILNNNSVDNRLVKILCCCVEVQPESLEVELEGSEIARGFKMMVRSSEAFCILDEDGSVS